MSQDKIEKWDEVNGNMGNNGRLEAFLDSAGDNYAILQLRDIEETRMERFSSLRMLERMDMEVNIDHYEVVYIAPLPIHTNRSTFLESVFEKFNLDRPEDLRVTAFRSATLLPSVKMARYPVITVTVSAFRNFPDLSRRII